ncbi:flavodoxin domain protein (plasmid) [Haloferax gibbonsii]|uniref:Flavodoxin domain protein n=1 Tax=Haloferax gibbonsii TaxID=35746 RepID=A0A871BKV7_HALGI|nr:flavodoxin domain protein [Haloferax gibbonsii]
MSETVCIAYYSRTGNTHQIATAIAAKFSDATLVRIRPSKERSYFNWLLRSFIPGSKTPIEPTPGDLHGFDAVFLGTPKWTFSCPPVTEYLDQINIESVPTGLFVTYGGFDEERYTNSLARDLRSKGADVRATLRVQRGSVSSPECNDGISRFCRQVVPDY